MLDEKITLEGLFTIVLLAENRKSADGKKIEYFFTTNSDGSSTCKSNDLNAMLSKVEAYYNEA